MFGKRRQLLNVEQFNRIVPADFPLIRDGSFNRGEFDDVQLILMPS